MSKNQSKKKRSSFDKRWRNPEKMVKWLHKHYQAFKKELLDEVDSNV